MKVNHFQRRSFQIGFVGKIPTNGLRKIIVLNHVIKIMKYYL